MLFILTPLFVRRCIVGYFCKRGPHFGIEKLRIEDFWL
jgi:hypothetical protein